ncbi:MAG: FecR domain-containing protein [bacterium]
MTRSKNTDRTFLIGKSCPFLNFYTILFVLFLAVPVSAEETVDNFSLSYLKGSARRRDNAKQEWQEVNQGDTLPANTKLRTEGNSYITVDLDKNSQININENSGLALSDEEDKDDVALHFGSINITIDTRLLRQRNREFTVKTPVAVLGVRGTTFQTSYELDAESWFGVDTGTVEIQADSQQTLSSGEGANVLIDTKTERSEIEKLPERRKELLTTWEHFRARVNLDSLQAKRDTVSNRIKSLQSESEEHEAGPELRLIEREISLLRRQRQQLAAQLENQKNRYQKIRKKYQQYRDKLEKMRDDFLERQRKSFDTFREKQKRGLELFRQQQKQNQRPAHPKRPEVKSPSSDTEPTN